MMTELFSMLANFTSPVELGTNPGSLIWFIPLAAAISLVYKAAKLPEIKMRSFLRESGTLFASIVVFMVLIGIGLLIFSWAVTE